MNRLAAANSPKVLFCAYWRAGFSDLNDTRALIGLCLLVMSQLDQIPDPLHSHAFTIAHIVIGLSLHILSFIHLRYYLLLVERHGTLVHSEMIFEIPRYIVSLIL